MFPSNPPKATRDALSIDFVNSRAEYATIYRASRSFSTCCEICKLPCHYLLASNRNRQRLRQDSTRGRLAVDAALAHARSLAHDCRLPTAACRLPLGVKSVIGSPPRLALRIQLPYPFPCPCPCPSPFPFPFAMPIAGCNPTLTYTLKSSVRPSDSW